jgi:hypothetical protein
MGYTHYFTPKKASPKKWDELLKQVKKLHEALPANTDTAGGYSSNDPLTIKGGLGKGEPEFSKKVICFNGDGDKGLDHETFIIEPDVTDWNFCKTARKPYDLLVCAVLIATRSILNYEVSSDGNLDDWTPAIIFYIDTIYDGKSLSHEEKEKLVNKIFHMTLEKN